MASQLVKYSSVLLLMASSCCMTAANEDCPEKHPLDCASLPDGLYADQYNCRKFWQCDQNSAGGGYHFTCEEDYLYDPNNKWCDFPDRVHCDGRPICDDCDDNCYPQPSPATTTEPVGECSELCVEDWGDFEVGCCSNVFCKCQGGVGFFINCQPGLVFVQSKDQCDYEYNVPCCNP